jgi:hypothetical protein
MLCPGHNTRTMLCPGHNIITMLCPGHSIKLMLCPGHNISLMLDECATPRIGPLFGKFLTLKLKAPKISFGTAPLKRIN